MKKFLAVVMVVLAVILFGGFTAPSAHSAEVTNVQSAVSVDTAVGPTTAVAPPQAISGPQPAWLYVSCYWAMNGARYCWRYGCSFYERVVLGCYDGWYRTTGWYA